MSATRSDNLDVLWRDPKSWRGMMYYCPDDPRLIVPMRLRWTGYSMNFAHGSAWPLLAGISLAVLAPFLLIVVLEPAEGVFGAAVAFVVSVSLLCSFCHGESTRSCCCHLVNLNFFFLF